MVLAGCAAAHQPTAEAPQEDRSPAEAHGRRPFFEARSQEAVYAGPGRETPPPEDLEEIKIGWFGPDDGQHPTAGLMWQAATLAVEEANSAGGLHGVPFRLVPCWSENPWGTGVKDVTRLIYDQGVWAIVGAPDGPSAHLVEQVTAKARLAFISSASTDKTANLANVAWIFSCVPGDHLFAPKLARAVMAEADGQGIVVVAGTDHDSRMTSKELLNELNRLGCFPAHRLDFRPGATDFDTQLQTIRRAGPAVVVVIAGAADSARLVVALRNAGLHMPVFGGPNMGRRLFAASAGGAAEGARFPLLWHPGVAGQRSESFARKFAGRCGVAPDYTAAYTYDAVGLLIAALRRAGLNRALIRDAVRELSGWPGVTGTITWDPTGQNTGRLTLGLVHNGQIIPERISSNSGRSRTK